MKSTLKQESTNESGGSALKKTVSMVSPGSTYEEGTKAQVRYSSKTRSSLATSALSDLLEEDDIEKAVDSSSSHHQSSTDESSELISQVDLIDIKTMTRRTKIIGLMVLLLGLSSSAGFMYFGFSSNADESTERFETRARELSLVVEITWLEYERTAASAHEICSRGDGTTRTEFQEFYEYLLADGIVFQSIQCVPNVTHAERPAHEKEAKAYWETRVPGFEYPGFSGIIFDAEKGDVTGVVLPMPERPYYFPIKYCEPPEGNLGAIDLDVYLDDETFKPLLRKSIQTQQPVLSGRINTVQETEESSYSVLVYHPGVPLSTQPNKVPDMFSSLVVRIPTLLDRVARLQEEDLAVYLYDNRPDGSKEFLGAAEYRVDEGGDDLTQVKFLSEVEYNKIASGAEKNRFHTEKIQIASGSWTVAVVPVDDTYDPENNLVIFGGVMLLVASIGIAFWMYTNMKQVVDIHMAKLEAEAERTIVANLFPENVRERLLRGAEQQNALKKENARMKLFGAKSNRVKPDALSSEGLFGSKPIADFHPETTLMFADLQGFTAWSSVREPSQVFTLLEVLYSAFDRIAKRRRVFKVETVGDCYIASAGVPTPRKDHAVVIARFAEDCLRAMPLIVNKLETTLGPETGDLGIRIGIHSGAVTSGVLRGDKGRFQLFGDTMNTASRMESTGMTNKIQVSPATVFHLQQANRGHWLVPRDTKVFVKGKGHLQTHWLVKHDEARSRASSDPMSEAQSTSGDQHSDKASRLVNWNVEEMTKLLKQVITRRKAKDLSVKQNSKQYVLPWSKKTFNDDSLMKFSRPLDEVKDVIELPEFDAKTYEQQITPESIELSKRVSSQLTEYVTRIGEMYQENPFHNFEHASHVAMSVTKLLSRIVTSQRQEEVLSTGKNYQSFGITSDPLTQFAAFYSALIHDVDHPGIPNTNFAIEEPDLAEIYKNKSIAEQNSIDLAWTLLMREEYNDLRLCICVDEEELKHFRQLVVQMVMSTDVMDKEIGALRKERWCKAFSQDERKGEDVDPAVDRNRKATIVIEHLIQASDVSHTMQHWHIYRKWNEGLFLEMYHAYKLGRLASDPSEGWYKGEMGFLDFYVLPLAKKLETCGVFGVSSDEFRIYATENRMEWERKGQEMVQEYLEKYNSTMLQ